MGTPTIYEIANELNDRASAHPIGTLQEVREKIRGYRTGNDLFRVNSKTTSDRWACHWGGRTELQFNIRLDGSDKLRHGVAFDFGSSRSYPSGELLVLLDSKVKLFNKFVQRHPEFFADMFLWVWDGNQGELVYDGRPKPIASRLLAENVFVFLGKLQSIHRIDYELILNDFDKLLPLYRYVESQGKVRPMSLPLETHFSFQPGCRTKKRSAIVRQSREQIACDLRHNELQKVLYRRLARQFGKENVGTENRGVNDIRIDLVVQRKRGYWFYEIKTAQSARTCIREALGQLLEYAFWPEAQEAARLIVAGECPIDKAAEDYLHCLREKFKLPIRYEQIKL